MNEKYMTNEWILREINELNIRIALAESHEQTAFLESMKEVYECELDYRYGKEVC